MSIHSPSNPLFMRTNKFAYVLICCFIPIQKKHTTKRCSKEGCSNVVYSKGVCKKHGTAPPGAAKAAPAAAAAAAAAAASGTPTLASSRSPPSAAALLTVPAEVKAKGKVGGKSSGRAISPLHGSDSGGDDQQAAAFLEDELQLDAVNALQTLQQNTAIVNDVVEVAFNTEDDFGVSNFPFTEPIGFRRIFSSDGMHDSSDSVGMGSVGSDGVGGGGGVGAGAIGGAEGEAGVAGSGGSGSIAGRLDLDPTMMQLMPSPPTAHVAAADDDDGIGKFPFSEPIGFRRIFSSAGDDGNTFTDGGLGPLAILASIAFSAAGM